MTDVPPPSPIPSPPTPAEPGREGLAGERTLPSPPEESGPAPVVEEAAPAPAPSAAPLSTTSGLDELAADHGRWRWSQGHAGVSEPAAAAEEPPRGDELAESHRRWRWRRGRRRASPEAVLSFEELHAGALPTAAPAARDGLTARERRWQRRRRRRVAEEVLGWILVPLILIGSYWLAKTILAGLGTTPGALIEGFKAALQGLERH